MNKRKIKVLEPIILTWLCLIIISVTSCEDDQPIEASGPPSIDKVLNYDATPNDTIVSSVFTGQWLVLVGSNLAEVSEAYFNGQPAVINNALYSDSSMVIQIPNIVFKSVNKNESNKILIRNSKGEASFDINITGPPEVIHIRNAGNLPNDTIVSGLGLGQRVNIIGYNLRTVSSISMQGIQIDMSKVVYTDSSIVLVVPEDFKDSDLSQKDKISLTNEVGTGSFIIKILVPEIVVDPFLQLLTGGVGPGKTWVLDFDSEGKAKVFAGPIGFSGDELRWDDKCAKEGGNCWTWFPEWQTWMPGPGDYGSMTFSIGDQGTVVNVDQKKISTSGSFTGFYSLSFEEKTLAFVGVVPLNMGWTSAVWSNAYVISLTEDAMRLGFKHKDKAELEIYHYIAKK